MKFHSPDSIDQDAGRLDIEHLMEDGRWHPLVDLIPDGVALIDRTGLLRYINPAAEAANEVLRIEVVDRSLREFAEKSRLDLAFLLDAFAGGVKTSRVVAGSFGNSTFQVITRCVRDWNGNINCMILVFRPMETTEQSVDAVRLDVDVRSTSNDASQVGRRRKEPIVLGRRATELLERGLRTLALGSRLLLLGESGVGKTEFAKFLHCKYGGSGQPFVHVNCGSIPETLFESEMFGYERGSFTGALAKGKRGLVEAADGGTLFLDEVGEIPLTSQGKMLQFIEEAAVQRVGATQTKRLRVQIIAATNRVLEDMVTEGTFRLDLFYRLSVVTLRMPPLRECPDILETLIDRFLDDVERRRGVPMRMDAACRQRLCAYRLPGNIRELQNIIEHLAVVCGRAVNLSELTEALGTLHYDVPTPAHGNAPSAVLEPGETLVQSVKRYEGQLIQEAIAQTGSKRKAATLLGVDIATISRKSRRTET
jgi:transcriptional regulator with PAS, ATPase and Fis domain